MVSHVVSELIAEKSPPGGLPRPQVCFNIKLYLSSLARVHYVSSAKTAREFQSWVPISRRLRFKKLLFHVRILLIKWINEVCVAERKRKKQFLNQSVKGETGKQDEY